MDSTFAALADPTRRAILARLASSPEESVTELARPFAMSLPAISKHLQVLEGAGLLARRRQGRVHHCRVVAAPLETANAWLDHYRGFWEQALDALARHIEESPEKKRRRSRSRRDARRSPGPRSARNRSSSSPKGKKEET